MDLSILFEVLYILSFKQVDNKGNESLTLLSVTDFNFTLLVGCCGAISPTLQTSSLYNEGNLEAVVFHNSQTQSSNLHIVLSTIPIVTTQIRETLISTFK